MPGIDAVSIEFARATGRDDDRVAEKRGEPIWVFSRAPLRRHCQHADCAVLLARRDEKSDTRCVVENRDLEPDRLAGQDLNHETRSSRTATRRPADLVMIGLVAQNAA